MINKSASDGSVTEGQIARDRRRASELGEEGLASARRESEQVIQDLGREPSFAERRCIEHACLLDTRIRALRKWNRHAQADDATALLIKVLAELDRLRRRS